MAAAACTLTVRRATSTGFVAHYNNYRRAAQHGSSRVSRWRRSSARAPATVVRARTGSRRRKRACSSTRPARRRRRAQARAEAVAHRLGGGQGAENGRANWGAVRHVGVSRAARHVRDAEPPRARDRAVRAAAACSTSSRTSRPATRSRRAPDLAPAHQRRDPPPPGRRRPPRGKPENVLCTDREPHLRGHVKLCDFGFASAFAVGRGAQLTQLVGTPEYLAPEMVRCADGGGGWGGESPPYTEAVDLWALGCLLYELLAGEPPFLHDDDDELYRMTLTMPVPFPRSHDWRRLRRLRRAPPRAPRARGGDAAGGRGAAEPPVARRRVADADPRAHLRRARRRGAAAPRAHRVGGEDAARCARAAGSRRASTRSRR